MYNYISEEVEFGSSLRVRELSPFLKRCDTEVYSNKAHYVLMQHWIIKQLCTVPVVKGSCAIVAESHMTLLWSSNGAKHWVGVDHRAAVHVCVCTRISGGTIHYTIQGSRQIRYVRVCVWMRSLCTEQNCRPISPAQTHMQSSMSTQTGAHSHGFLWQLQTNSRCMWWPHPNRKKKGETKTEKQKQK